MAPNSRRIRLANFSASSGSVWTHGKDMRAPLRVIPYHMTHPRMDNLGPALSKILHLI
ncbi:hypothetical protein BDV40DRAFT_272733 [Aspergillus tamarii]|uniref:Uncharacterized protein n=1 Tax=Aspergillus tamarii TaxID=41984 RepID=A0A5N6ULW5_ASPTM|nr:hypothetical protein BDV40DRAFT_272733 [Aspergillus tamarii]